MCKVYGWTDKTDPRQKVIRNYSSVKLKTTKLSRLHVGCKVLSVTDSVPSHNTVHMLQCLMKFILFHYRGMIGIVLTVLTVVWCSFSSSKLFVSALSMENQQPLVAYPCGLVYGVFALLTVF